VVGGGIVGLGLAVWFNVNDNGDRCGEGVMEGMFN